LLVQKTGLSGGHRPYAACLRLPQRSCYWRIRRYAADFGRRPALRISRYFRYAARRSSPAPSAVECCRRPLREPGRGRV